MKFDTKIDTAGFTKGTNTIKSQANGLKSVLASLGKAMVVAFSVTALINFGRQAIDTASDLTEVQNVVDTAFGDMAYKIEDFAKTSIQNFGLSKLAAKQMASTYMAMSTGMGQMAGTASDMAVTITGRLGDVMSFYNKTASEVDTIGKAIYTGETEPLKAIGVVMTEANLNAYALAQGMNKAYSEMSSGEKLLVRQQFFLKQTSLAAGDFVKTSGSWANQTRVLSEQWKEFLGILGNGLIQVLTPAIKMLNSAMSYMITFANTASKVLSSVFGLSSATTSVANNTADIAIGAEDASAGLSDMGTSAKKAAKDAKGGVAGFDQLNNTTENLAESSADAAGALSGIGGIDASMPVTTEVGAADTSELEKGLTEMAKKIKTVLKPTTDALKRLKVAITPFAKNVGAGLKWFFDNVLVPLGTWIITDYIPAWLDNLGAVIGVLNALLVTFQPLGLWLWNSFLKPIATWTGGLIIDILKGITTGLNALSTWILDNQGTVQGIGKAFLEVGAALTILTNPIAKISLVLGLIIGTFTDLYSNSESFRQSIDELGRTWGTALQPLAEFVGTVLADAWSKILKPAIDYFVDTLLPNLSSLFKDLWENVLVPLGTFIGTVLQPVFKVLSDVLKKLWKEIVLPLATAVGKTLSEAWDGIYKILNETVIPIVKTVITTLTKLWKEVINPIVTALWDNMKPAFDTVFGGIGDLIEGLQTTLSGMIKFITGVFTGDWSKAWQGVKKIFKGVFTTMATVVKSPINLIIDMVNSMVGGIVTAINTIVKAVNAMSFTVPDWVIGIGGKKFGFDLKTITAPTIPKLATGTVIPPNSEFMAILGDQKKGVNIEAPLDTIVEAFKKVEGQGGGGNGTINLNVYLTGKQIHTEVVKIDKEVQAQTGYSAFAPA